MRPGVGAVARRYAQATLELAEEKGEAAQVREDLRDARRTLSDNEELHRALTHPALAAERRRNVAVEVFGSRCQTALVPRLLGLLAERGRADLIAAIEEAYVDAWNDQRGVVAVEAFVAIELDAEQQAALTRVLESITGQPVELRLTQDPELLGGLKLSLAGHVYDGTVRARLRALRSRLSGRA